MNGAAVLCFVQCLKCRGRQPGHPSCCEGARRVSIYFATLDARSAAYLVYCFKGLAHPRLQLGIIGLGTRRVNICTERGDLHLAASPSPAPAPAPPQREDGNNNWGPSTTNDMSGRQSPMYALSSSGRSTPLTLDQEMQLGVASWSRGPPEPPLSSSRDNQDREGVHGGTGLYAYSITSNKKKTKGKAWRPTSAIKTITSPL